MSLLKKSINICVN